MILVYAALGAHPAIGNILKRRARLDSLKRIAKVLLVDPAANDANVLHHDICSLFSHASQSPLQLDPVLAQPAFESVDRFLILAGLLFGLQQQITQPPVHRELRTEAARLRV